MHQQHASRYPIALAILVLGWSGTGLSAQISALDELLDRTAAYLRDTLPTLANIVATEEYLQRAGTGPPRMFKSDLLLVNYPGSDANFMVFRDVVEAAGVRLKHPPDRLIKLFIAPTADASTQAEAIAAESTRYFVRGTPFAVTNPFVAVALLQQYYQPQLRFTLGPEDRSIGADVRVLKFQEIEQRGSKRLFGALGRVRGSAWIEQRSGRIVKTETEVLPDAIGSAVSTTTFAFDERLGVMVPVELRATWGLRDAYKAVATYGRFRRFGVDTSTTTVLPSKP